MSMTTERPPEYGRGLMAEVYLAWRAKDLLTRILLERAEALGPRPDEPEEVQQIRARLAKARA